MFWECTETFWTGMDWHWQNPMVNFRKFHLTPYPEANKNQTAGAQCVKDPKSPTGILACVIGREERELSPPEQPSAGSCCHPFGWPLPRWIHTELFDLQLFGLPQLRAFLHLMAQVPSCCALTLASTKNSSLVIFCYGWAEEGKTPKMRGWRVEMKIRRKHSKSKTSLNLKV